ncbi:unnamed protein product, partial [Nippostrongylus brasiliensis]|uniref:Partitioning defective 3 B n=1 Tax=Nippostrongylus brasiliensis TaxID=27835 RepID=A0A0N4XCH1_NIPBR
IAPGPYPGQGGQGTAPAPYRDTKYPSNANYQQNERMHPAPRVSASGGDGLAYTNSRARRF